MPERKPHRVEILLIRHGQSDWNGEGRCQGQLDFSHLTPEGEEQARALARDLPRTPPISAVYTSSQRRAIQTAEIVAEALSAPLHADHRLREMGQGLWEGMTYNDILLRYGQLYQQFMDNPLAATPPGGESIEQVARRVSAAADDIAGQHPGQRVVMVSHELPIAALRCRAARQPLSALWSVAPGNGQSLALEWPPDRLGWMGLLRQWYEYWWAFAGRSKQGSGI